ncbi:hypothetical protein F5884DRAFT_781702 [Xylogone sp. PMI_703]|nr:hypothetical protein F5884DRAFT_781702 [Xylogone sp. PMI_703]
MSIYDRIANVEYAIRNSSEIDFRVLDPPDEEKLPMRHSLDYRVDSTPRSSIDSGSGRPRTKSNAPSRTSSLKSLASRSKRPSPLPRIDSERLTSTSTVTTDIDVTSVTINNTTTTNTTINSNNPFLTTNNNNNQYDIIRDSSPVLGLDSQSSFSAPEKPTSPPPPLEALPPLEERMEKLNLKDEDSIGAQLGLNRIDSLSSYTDYKIYNAFLTNLRICPVDLSGRYFYVEHRSFLPNTPGAILHGGVDKEGPILGVAHLPLLSGTNSIGIGDHKNNPTAVQWEKLERTTFWTHMRYVFEWELPDGERRRFLWIRTRNMLLDDQGDLVLIEEGKESLVLAEYFGRGLLKWKKRGKLRLRNIEALGEHWEEMVLLTWAAVVELSRRRARQRRFSNVHLLL